jgi:hypothetical protein
MGAAHSSNVADAVTNVVNNISQETTTNNTQVQTIENNVNFTDCITQAGSLDIKTSAITVQKSNQITSALQNSHIKNDLQQKMLQAAESTVGSIGIGFADSTNSASMMANASTNISSEMSTVSSQTSNTSNSFTCEDSTFNIAGGFNIDLLSNSDFLSSQTVQAHQVSSVVNKVSQTADQKAKATVDGIGAALLCLAVLIIAIGWAFSKSVTAVADNKGAQKTWQNVGIVIGIVLFTGLVVTAYLLDWPPFFGKTNDCISTGAISGCKDTCINFDSDGSIKLESAPLRYTHPITNAFPSAIKYVNLLEMAIIVSAGDGRINGGYNPKNYKFLKLKIDTANTQYGPMIKKSIPNLGTMPYLLTVDKVAIPDAFLNNGSSSPNAGACTPGAFNKNTPGSSPIDVNTLGTSINGGPLFCPQQGTLPSIPAGTTDDNTLANINDDEINNWINGYDLTLKEPALSDTKNARALFARFVLCDIISLIDLNVYISNTNELVKYIDKDGNTLVTTSDDKNAQDYCYLFKPYGTYDFTSSCNTGGDFVGKIGVCDDKYYKMKYYSRIGFYIAAAIVGLVGFIILLKFFWPDTGTYTSSTSSQAIEMATLQK